MYTSIWVFLRVVSLALCLTGGGNLRRCVDAAEYAPNVGSTLPSGLQLNQLAYASISSAAGFAGGGLTLAFA